MFQRSGGSKVSESYVNHGGELRGLINMGWEVGRANILLIGVTGFTGIRKVLHYLRAKPSILPLRANRREYC